MSSPTPRTPRNRNPLALDVAAFCRDAAVLEGEWTIAEMPRLAESVVLGADGFAEAPVQWAASGRLERPPGGAPQSVVDLRINTRVVLECQRCLQAMALPLHFERRFRFVQGEDEAASLDEELEDDVLALTPRLNLRALGEDELLLSLPLVPRHEACPDLPLALRPGAGVLDATAAAALEPMRVDPASAARLEAPGAPDGDTAPSGEPHPFAALAALRGLKR